MLKARLKLVFAICFILGLVATLAMATTETKIVSDRGLDIKEVAILVEKRLKEGSTAIFVNTDWEGGYKLSAHFDGCN